MRHDLKLILTLVLLCSQALANPERWREQLRSRDPATRSKAAASLQNAQDRSPETIQALFDTANNIPSQQKEGDEGLSAWSASWNALLELAPSDPRTLSIYLKATTIRHRQEVSLGFLLEVGLFHDRETLQKISFTSATADFFLDDSADDVNTQAQLLILLVEKKMAGEKALAAYEKLLKTMPLDNDYFDLLMAYVEQLPKETRKKFRPTLVETANRVLAKYAAPSPDAYEFFHTSRAEYFDRLLQLIVESDPEEAKSPETLELLRRSLQAVRAVGGHDDPVLYALRVAVHGKKPLTPSEKIEGFYRMFQFMYGKRLDDTLRSATLPRRIEGVRLMIPWIRPEEAVLLIEDALSFHPAEREAFLAGLRENADPKLLEILSKVKDCGGAVGELDPNG